MHAIKIADQRGRRPYVAICKAATEPLPDKLLGPWFLGAKNKDGEILNCSKTIQEDYLSNLQALKPIINQMVHYDLKGVLLVLLVYNDHGLTYEDCWNIHSPDFSTIDISQNLNQVTMSHCKKIGSETLMIMLSTRTTSQVSG